MNKIVVVDYGMGNLRSVAQALRAVAPDANVLISGDPLDIDSADRIGNPAQFDSGQRCELFAQPPDVWNLGQPRRQGRGPEIRFHHEIRCHH